MTSTMQSRLLAPAALVLALCSAGQAAAERAQPLTASDAIRVFHLQVSFSEAYLVKGPGPKLLLIDAGTPGGGPEIEQQVKALGFQMEDIGLVVLTHGHADHAGSARFLQDKYKIPVAGSAGDLDKFSRGKTDLAKAESIGAWAERLRPVAELSYPAFSPDVVIDRGEVDLARYGVPGTIIPLPGHTPGSLIVRVQRHLFVGDLIRGTFRSAGPLLVPNGHRLTEHLFHENRALAKAQLATVDRLLTAGIETVYPTHWGPVTAHEARRYIRALPLLTELTKLQEAVLDDIVHKRTDRLARVLDDDAQIVTPHGAVLDKPGFLGQVADPSTTFETLAASDFRLVYADGTTAVLTFKELRKLSGQPQERESFVTVTYVRQGKAWRGVAVQGTDAAP